MHVRFSYASASLLVLLMFQVISPRFSSGEERRESFDRDPGWDGLNNRPATPSTYEVQQDFGYSPTKHAGGEPGELGGLLTPAAEPAYYAKAITEQSFDDRMTASGKLACTGRQFHVLLGFFNNKTINDWRTPNSITVRLYGRGEVFYAYVEYATSRWRAGGDSPGGFATVLDTTTGKPQLRGFRSEGAVHKWTISYDPVGNNGTGSIRVTIDDETAICNLDPGHKQDGATFDRFGLLNIPKHLDQGGEVWLDDISINGQTEDFSNDPTWDERGNRSKYITESVRPRFDFGFSATNYAGGLKSGELGGTIFRGDNRSQEKLAYYGDRVESLTPEKPLRAAGKIAMRRGISDSTSLIGFFHSQDSVAVASSQSSAFPTNFLGIAVEGPSREGFLVYPVYRFADGADGYARGSELPHILPDGATHDWTLEYTPAESATGKGRLSLVFDGQQADLEVSGNADQQERARFDRFGIVTSWIDGNAQHLYLDDLIYTCKQ